MNTPHPHRAAFRRARLAALSCCTPLLAQAPQFQATSPAALSPTTTLSTVGNLFAHGDVDGDGNVDLCILRVPGVSAAPLLVRNDGLGHLTDISAQLPAVNWPWIQRSVALFDLDVDGDRDLFINWDPGYVLLRNLGGGTWVDATSTLPALPMMQRTAVADLDGDGDEDIVACGHWIIGGTNLVLRNTGTSLQPVNAIPGTSIFVALADIDGDVDIDIATMAQGQLQMYRNQGALQFTALAPITLANYLELTFGDVDGDGDQDLAVGGAYNNPDRLLRNHGAGGFTPGASLPTNAGGSITLRFADVDEDGDLDLLRGANPQPNLLLNDGTGTFTVAPARWPLVPTDSFHVQPVDLDRDGDVDAVLHMTTVPGRVMWNHHRHLKAATPPAIGQPWPVELWSQPGYGTGVRGAVLAIGLARIGQPLLLPPFGALWLDLGAPFTLLPTTIAAPMGTTTLPLAIPAAAALVGVTLHAQALIEEQPGSGDLRLTSMVSATIR